jgi:hypothetical protein
MVRSASAGTWLGCFESTGIQDSYGVVQGKKSYQGKELGVDQPFYDSTLGSIMVAP